jgi:hypothetical protein
MKSIMAQRRPQRLSAVTSAARGKSRLDMLGSRFSEPDPEPRRGLLWDVGSPTLNGIVDQSRRGDILNRNPYRLEDRRC